MTRLVRTLRALLFGPTLEPEATYRCPDCAQPFDPVRLDEHTTVCPACGVITLDPPQIDLDDVERAS